MGLIVTKEVKEKRAAEKADAKEKKQQAYRAEQRRQVGKGTYREFSVEGLFGCWEGWPFHVKDGSLVNFLDGTPPDTEGCFAMPPRASTPITEPSGFAAI